MSQEAHYLKGQLLLDSGQLRGSYFQRTVILLCEHNAEGAMGLVLNRPSGKQLGEMVAVDMPAAFQDHPLYLGGPVELAAFSFLHTDLYLPDANVIANLSVGHSLEALAELGGSESPRQQVKMFAGYAGWSAGQLESEMERDAWLTYPANLDLVFHADPENLWRTVLRQKGWKYRILADMPEDVSLN